MAGRFLIAMLVSVSVLVAGCKAQKPAEEPKKQEPAVIVMPQHPVLAREERTELGFPDDLIAKIELSAGTEAEPFYATVFVPSENLKGDKGFEKEKLAGFSVRTTHADELITSYRSGLRVKGFLIFKSHRGYGSLPDIVTVVRGNSSYDLLKLQATEAAGYHLDTKAIIVWLKQQQKLGSFVITGAGTDWLEARFVKPPADMHLFARKVLAFAPDVREYGPRSVNRLAERMKKTNSFYLIWD